MAPENPDPVLLASQSASQSVQSTSRRPQSKLVSGCRGTYLASLPPRPRPHLAPPRSCPFRRSLLPANMGQTFPPRQDGHPKLKLSSSSHRRMYCGARVFLPPAVGAGCGKGYLLCRTVLAWLWYTSCTSRITSDKRLPPPPASSGQTPFPVVPRSCLRLPVPTFCPSTIRCAPSLIPRFPDFFLSLPRPFRSRPVHPSFFTTSHPAVCRLIRASLLLPLQFALLVLLHPSCLT